MKSEHIRVNIYASRLMRNEVKYYAVMAGFNDMSEFMRLAIESQIASHLEGLKGKDKLNLPNVAAVHDTVEVIDDLKHEALTLPVRFKPELDSVVTTLQAAVELSKCKLEENASLFAPAHNSNLLIDA